MALTEFDLPFEGTSIHCWEGGSGFPILMLHGSGAGASIPGNYRRVIDALSRKYRLEPRTRLRYAVGLYQRRTTRAARRA